MIDKVHRMFHILNFSYPLITQLLPIQNDITQAFYCDRPGLVRTCCPL